MSEEITRRRFIIAGATAAVVVGAGAGITAAIAQPAVNHPSTKIGAGMKKALVVYGTKSGCSAGVAQRIGKTLAAKGIEVQIAPAESAGKAADYDAVIVGSGVRMGQWHEPARTWVAANAEALKANPPALFTVGMTLASEPDATDKVRAFTDTLLAETGVKPVDVGVFAGWNTGEGFSFVERAILGAMKTPKGDFRDWAAIEAWTNQVAPQLHVS